MKKEIKLEKFPDSYIDPAKMDHLEKGADISDKELFMVLFILVLLVVVVLNIKF